MDKNTITGEVRPVGSTFSGNKEIAIDTLLKMFNPVLEDVDVTRCDATEHHDEVFGLLRLEEDIKPLAASMEEIGQVKPAVGRRLNDRIELLDGVRLHSAAEFLGWKTITVLVVEVDDDDALLLSQVLNSGARRMTWKIRARQFHLIKQNAKRLLREAKDDGNSTTEETTRQYVARVLMMKERSVSDFERVLESPDADYLISEMDKGLIRLNKALHLATKGVRPPVPKSQCPVDKQDFFTCDVCPRRAQFQKKLESAADEAYELEDADDKVVEGGTHE